MLSAVLGSDYARAENIYRPDTQVTTSAPPMFIWHTADDELVPAWNSDLLAAALLAHGVPHELHIFQVVSMA